MDGVIAFIDAFPEWHRVAIISQDEEMFRKARQMAMENVVYAYIVFDHFSVNKYLSMLHIQVAVYVEERFSFKNISVVSSKVISRATLHDIVINELVVSHIYNL